MIISGGTSSFLDDIVRMVILSVTGSVIILPGVVLHFFTFSILRAFVNGLLFPYLPVFLMPVLGNLGFANVTFSDADFVASGILLGNIAKSFGATGVIVTVVGLVLITVGIWLL